MKELNVVIPGLVWPDLGDYAYLYGQLPLVNFSHLLNKAEFIRHPLLVSDFMLTNLPPLTTVPITIGTVSTGAVLTGTALANCYAKNLGLADYPFYLLAEPTHLRVDRDRLLISEAELLQLNEAEAREIIQTLNEHFAAEVKFYYLSEELWLVGLKLDVSQLNSHPIIDIVGENIDEYLPAGKNALKLHQLLNEIQMLLFNLALNEERQSEGLLVVNSVWLWDKSSPQLPFTLGNTFSNNPKFGLAIDNLQHALANCDTLIVDQAYYPSCYRDSFSWLKIVAELEQRLAKELLSQLKLRRINLWLPQADECWQFKLSYRDLYKFWRKKSLPELFNSLR